MVVKYSKVKHLNQLLDDKKFRKTPIARGGTSKVFVSNKDDSKILRVQEFNETLEKKGFVLKKWHNKIIPGDSANRKGTNKLLKFLKKIRFLFFSFELINKINNGPKPIKIIKKYLIKISKEYLFILC